MSPAPQPHALPVFARDRYVIHDCDVCRQLNQTVSARILAIKDSELAQKSHFFAGRFENVYLPADQIPALQTLLDTALAYGAKLLASDPSTLRLGFWFNIMQAGDVTLPHAHDDTDELLSGTYYLLTPPGAGELVLHLPGGAQTLSPSAGRFVFFHPAIEHEVKPHQNAAPRLSIGFNIGPRNSSA